MITAKWDKLLLVFKRIVSLLLLLIMFFLLIKSFISTASVKNLSNIGGHGEVVFYSKDNIFLNSMLLLIGVGGLYLIRPLLLKIRLKHLALFTSLFTFVIGIIWILGVQMGVSADSGIIVNHAYEFAIGNYGGLEDVYYQHYPFQLGFTLFCQVFFSLLSLNNKAIFFEIVNLICIIFTYLALIIFCKICFKNEMYAKYSSIFCMFCMQSILFSCFVYGIIPALMLSSWSILLYFLYKKTNKLYFLPVSAFLLGIAVLLKYNSMITLIAMIIISFIYILKSKDIKYCGFIIIALLFTMGLKSTVICWYENKGNIDFSNSEPLAGWLAMGLQESKSAPGWWNSYNYDNFEISGRDQEIAKENAYKNISLSLTKFNEDRIYFLNFFKNKVLSQWNEPTFESLWFGTTRDSYIERKGIFKEAYINIDDNFFYYYMNFYQQFVYVFVFVFLIYDIKNTNTNMESMVFVLTIIGGFFYHLFFEAKSQFIFPYFILMIPLAAIGFTKGNKNLMKFLKDNIEGINNEK